MILTAKFFSVEKYIVLKCQCPLWVISLHKTHSSHPLPQKRTFVSALSMSALCHEETSPEHAAAALQTARRRALRDGALKRTRVLQGLNSNRVISISIRDAE